MEKTEDRRVEQRLCYRWPVRFAKNVKDKPFQGQIVDASSNSLSFLCRAKEGCPQPDQLVKVDFGVPYFDETDSFDAVFFNRITRVCRVDRLSDIINRVVVRFAKPLFFKPGHQNITESDAKQRLENKAVLVTQAEQKARYYSEALIMAEEKVLSLTQTKEMLESQLKEEIEKRHSLEAGLRTQSKEEIEKRTQYENLKTQTEERLEEQLKAETEKRLQAEAKLKEQAQEEITKRIQEEAELRAQLDDEIEKRVREEAKLREQAEEEVRV
ncbi:MAG: hypothetical protein PVJ60_08055, partial [Phycisphaerales bacterium]